MTARSSPKDPLSSGIPSSATPARSAFVSGEDKDSQSGRKRRLLHKKTIRTVREKGKNSAKKKKKSYLARLYRAKFRARHKVPTGLYRPLIIAGTRLRLSLVLGYRWIETAKRKEQRIRAAARKIRGGARNVNGNRA